MEGDHWAGNRKTLIGTVGRESRPMLGCPLNSQVEFTGIIYLSSKIERYYSLDYHKLGG